MRASLRKAIWLGAVACLLLPGCSDDLAPPRPVAAGVADVPDSTFQVVVAIANAQVAHETPDEVARAWSDSSARRLLEAHWRALVAQGTVSPGAFDYQRARGGVFETKLGAVSMFLAPSSEVTQDAQMVRAEWSGGSALWLEYWAPGESGPELTLAFATPRGVATSTFGAFIGEQEQRGEAGGGSLQQPLERPATVCNSRIDQACGELTSIVGDSQAWLCTLRALPMLMQHTMRFCAPLAPALGVGFAVCATALAGTVGYFVCSQTLRVSKEAAAAACSMVAGCAFRALGFDSCSCVEFVSDGCAERCTKVVADGVCGMVDKVGLKTSSNYRSPITNAICRGLEYAGERGPLSQGGEFCKKALKKVCSEPIKHSVKPVCECVCNNALDVSLDDCPGEQAGAGGAGSANDGTAGAATDGSSAGANSGEGGAPNAEGQAGADGEDGDDGDSGGAGSGGDAGSDASDVEAWATGDPHFRTFDGMGYDLQASGEFVLAGLTDEPLGDRIQTRQQALASDICPHVTWNTALAAQLGAARLGFYGSDPPAVLVDGAATPLAVSEGVDLGQGVVLTRVSEHRWQVAWGGSGVLTVQFAPARNQYYLDVTVKPPRSWFRRTRGLLGNFDQSPGNDLQLPDGTFLVQPPSWEDFYLKYAPAQQVTNDDSAFDYAPGESVETFRHAALPGRPPTRASLPPALRELAEAVCDATGVTDPTLLDACVNDVACSGGNPQHAEWIKSVVPPTTSVALSAGPTTCQGGPCGTGVGAEPSNPGHSCADIVARDGARGDAIYWLQPPGAAAPFQAPCDMSTLGGGWTRVTSQVTPLLDAQTPKTYLYVHADRWYRSPVTPLAWDWAKGQELLGNYTYFDGAQVSTYGCPGSDEKPPFGIGCSSGPFATPKTIPWAHYEAALGTCQVCQNSPAAFGSGACYDDVAIYVRPEP